MGGNKSGLAFLDYRDYPGDDRICIIKVSVKKALIIGSAISGKSAARFLLKKGYEVTCVDSKEVHMDIPISFFSDHHDFPNWDFDLVVVSPGIAPNHPLLKRAEKEKTQVMGELELGCQHIQQACIAVTGTNGKTTTTSLICHVLNACHIKAIALGNIGKPLTEYLLHPDPEEVIILEVSSFQLETMHCQCFDHAILLNIFPDHLDRYENVFEYARVKGRIGELVKSGGFLYLSKGVQEQFPSVIPNIPQKVIPEIPNNLRPDIVSQNVSAALQICKTFAISEENFATCISIFQKPPHRIEYIKELNGISFYNDSKATTVDSVIVAVKYLKKDIWLLAGGVDKGVSYKYWISTFRGKVKGVYVFGQAADKIAHDLGEEFLVIRVANLEQAIEQSFNKAKKGEKILLSPGCSSYDQFQNYERRGELFRKEVERLT